ncbi:MAG: hypothetical protein UT65_C0018G0008 [Parcubacteria group bacterium GW2011_GWF2_39_8b]|uniref:26 kDa periplasmic immunogenic protein n=1 Tax=Candidatus Zambryskibacteria bacterium RIFCSPHIGHO2_02_38_10.5 TaxID=1802742 RepID=A0A1G2T8K4_9BACT|nr:MAG: hypothetical protein UT65_C0018G0008 [Parcubacteria group bacterium GW2011_GWF2_39_8b]KKR45553.1 MAG: hypothetical protein UT81_C0011G0017 [Parcubacteria group bacterium GW2011_GWA2_40_14]OHA93617.1 MAG: hypothetical protein A2W58_01680 [Candidatus Zambryskibacteria bacterium RIFCSPHIGHO2_02_38_10.5]OHA96250.1 MAG: hypothetical protein A3C63_02415 [Candidatus Zambryskibacteria bacterium RIFCSPHIGHO2_02_FULL_39_82]OHB08818.1 MAG: hypothetical protein A2W64_02780 [Candidatus Zambryskibact
MDQFLNNTAISPEKKKLFKAMFAVFVLLAVFLGVESISALKEYSHIGRGVYPSNVIAVTGTGEILAIPDTGSFSFSVVEEAKGVQDAQTKASKKINTIILALKDMGVSEKDIKTTSYNSYPKYEYRGTVCTQSYPSYCPPSKQVLIGYEVSQSVSVKIRKIEDSGAILTKVGDLGVSNISGLDFVIDEVEKVQAEARDKAIALAKAKAKVLSKSLGIKLKRIVNFYEQGNGSPIYYGMEARGMGGDIMPSTPPQIPVGENKVVSNVTITYEIE